SACTPRVTRFDAAPDRICRGGTTLVSWSVTGNAELSSEPAVQGTGPVESTGSREFSLTEPTRFVMVASYPWKKSEPGVRDVKVFQLRGEQEIMGHTTCRPGWVVASITLPREDWDTLVRVDSVHIVGSRRVKVEHEGKVANLSLSHKDSAEFAGSSASGD